MITRVYGTVDGVEVIFTPSPDNTWTCTVPRTADGEYIVDLYAENDAGNTTYFATVLFTVRGVEVTVTWLTVNTAASMSAFDVEAVLLQSPHAFDVEAVLLSSTRPRAISGT